MLVSYVNIYFVTMDKTLISNLLKPTERETYNILYSQSKFAKISKIMLSTTHIRKFLNLY